MIAKDLESKKQLVRQLLEDAHAHAYPTGDLNHVARAILEHRGRLLALAEEHGTPFYAYDDAGFADALSSFRKHFDAHLPQHRAFYAVKSNPHPLLIAAAVRGGYGLDVSSGRELALALALPCPIVFSGPAKSPSELTTAVEHADRVIINLDSFRELERLGHATAALGKTARAGVRVFTDHHGAWSKFGIPIHDLARFWREAKKYPRVLLEGIKFHLSWNRDARTYAAILEELARTLSRDFTPDERKAIRFLDLGGGYRPHLLEGYFPGDHPLGAVIQSASAHYGEETEFTAPFYVKPSVPLSEYAETSGRAIHEHLRPLVDCEYFTEPGRVVSTFAMHIVLRVVDRKADDLVIVDGGINMVGWEKYLATYCPVVNLTRPASRELEMRIGGSLCDCEDMWGARVYGERVEEGDVLVVPFQGAYSFSTAQEFIRAIPRVHAM